MEINQTQKAIQKRKNVCLINTLQEKNLPFYLQQIILYLVRFSALFFTSTHNNVKVLRLRLSNEALHLNVDVNNSDVRPCYQTRAPVTYHSKMQMNATVLICMQS